MYNCKDSKRRFENFKVIIERHGLDSAPYQKIAVCPICGGTDLEQFAVSHCRYCGARLKRKDGVYCGPQCRKNGEILWRLEEKRRKQRTQDPVNIITKRLEEYNKLHKTNYSYGQFVSLVLPRLS